MPTLLQINVVANWGSTGRIAEEIGQYVLAKGWNSYIAYGRGNPVSKSQLFKIGNRLDMYWHGVESLLFDRHGLSSHYPTRMLIAFIESIKPDIIHLHNIHGYYVNYRMLFSYLSTLKTPIVWTLHDCWTFTGHCAYFSFIGCERWKQGCLSCINKRSYPSSILFSSSARNFQLKEKCFLSPANMTLVPVSKWLEGLLRESFFHATRIKTILNGINLEQFKPLANKVTFRESHGIHQQYLILGVASVWDARKGLSDFIKLRNFLPESSFSIVLIGLNNQQIKRLPKGIIGVPRTNSVKELNEYYSAADLFLNLTYEDNFPTTNLEALSSGTPVITYNTGGSIESVDGNTGAIVEQGNMTMLIEAIHSLLSNDTQQMSKDCRLRAEKLYNKNDRWAEYLELYETLLH